MTGDFWVQTQRGSYLVRDHGDMGFAVVPPYSPGPPDYWANTAEDAESWCYGDAEDA